MLCACTSAPRSPEPTNTFLQCAPVTRCTLPATAPRTNDELRRALDVTEAAWGECAARVDMIAACQARGLPLPDEAGHE
ncbi:Rz1-like lysis system protein LysC [Paraburkholderia sp. BR10936]|uniref:Rz1-like lysis system protein LysC n=1 Tax=Paraburkholderia sp. BR10936 TaxID=3236993 RepID=UPI0034D1ACEB